METSRSAEGREVRDALQCSSTYTQPHSCERILIVGQNATYAALTRAEQQLGSGQTAVELAHTLIDASKDVLALALDKQVSGSRTCRTLC